MSKITRRNFLKIFGVVAGAAAVPQLPAPVETPAATKISISQELLDDLQWEPYRTYSGANSDTTITAQEGMIALFENGFMVYVDGEWHHAGHGGYGYAD